MPYLEVTSMDISTRLTTRNAGKLESNDLSYSSSAKSASKVEKFMWTRRAG